MTAAKRLAVFLLTFVITLYLLPISVVEGARADSSGYVVVSQTDDQLVLVNHMAEKLAVSVKGNADVIWAYPDQTVFLPLGEQLNLDGDGVRMIVHWQLSRESSEDTIPLFVSDQEIKIFAQVGVNIKCGTTSALSSTNSQHPLQWQMEANKIICTLGSSTNHEISL